MSRHLLIGSDTVFARTTNGLVDDGAISVQKMSASGPTELVLGDTLANAPQIRVVMGDVNGNDTASPWIYGKDVINWSGKSYVAAAACTVTNTIAATSAAAGTLVLKFVKLSGPTIEFFSFSTAIAASVAHTDADLLVKAAYEAASLPDWLNVAANASAGATVVFSGSKRGDVAQSGNTWDYEPAQIQLIVESYDGGTQTHTASATTGGSPGYGDGQAVKAFEDANMGSQYGYYERRNLPNTPANNAVVGTSYDMYSLVATKDGSSSSQINGVDNLIEINIALRAGSAVSLVVENKLNAYLASSFANVIL
tara:strand:+ start:15759 stop:16688 length:930 start_codon:yes stop_codon:yes gene_type:complete